jgi:hypothetical protein
MLAFFVVLTAYGIYRNQKDKQICENIESTKAEL